MLLPRKRMVLEDAKKELVEVQDKENPKDNCRTTIFSVDNYGEGEIL